MRWVDALKEWNKGSPTWCIARKGTKAYDEVKAIMAAGKKFDAPKSKAEVKEMEGIDIKELMRARKQKAKLEGLKQSAKEVVASTMASIPEVAPRKDMMPSIMGSIAEIAKKTQAAKAAKPKRKPVMGALPAVPVANPLPVMEEKKNKSKTETEEELDVGFIYKNASVFEKIAEEYLERDRKFAMLIDAIKSFGEWVSQRFARREISGDKYYSRSTGPEEYRGGGFEIGDVRKQYPTYWEQWEPIIDKELSTPKVGVRISSYGYIKVYNLLDQNGNIPKNTQDVNKAFVAECREWMNDENLPTVDRLQLVKKYPDDRKMERASEEKIKAADEELKKLVIEIIEASKKAKASTMYKWKGRERYMKKIDNLWEKYPGDMNRFIRIIPMNFTWEPIKVEVDVDGRRRHKVGL
jgi:hypothetical protein